MNISAKQFSLDPAYVLKFHHELRRIGVSVLSILVGQVSQARALWGQSCAEVGISPRTAPGKTVSSVADAFEFFLALADSERPQSGLFVVPEQIESKEVEECLQFVKNHPTYPMGLALRDVEAKQFLETESVLVSHREEFLKGVIAIPGVATLGPSLASSSPLYRSPHEEIIHKLMQSNPDFEFDFRPNSYRVGSSGTRYEVDLFCEELMIALEVDGSQHWNSKSQIKRDQNRDRDLLEAGVATIRVRANEIISDPSTVLQHIRMRINQIIEKTKNEQFPNRV